MIGKKALSDIGLLVQVHYETSMAALLTDRCDEPAEVRFAHPAFEIERCNHLGLAERRVWHEPEITV